MARFTYIPNRVIDSDGISDGANIYFYATGTTTPITIYSDEGLTTPISNPVVVASGAAVAPVYYTDATIRVKVVDGGGATVSDDDPYNRPVTQSELSSTASGKGLALTGFIQAGTGAVARTGLAKLRETVSVKDFGAVGDGVVDDTTAIVAALAAMPVGGVLRFPAGTYRVTAQITVSSAKRLSLIGEGPRQSVLSYDGANATNDCFVFGDAAADCNGYLVSGLGFSSTTNMTGGALVRFKRLTRSALHDVHFGHQDGNGNAFNAVWFDELDKVALTSFQCRGKEDGLRVNGGTGGRADLFIDGGKIASCKNGLHVAGDFGGLYADALSLINNGTNCLIDQAVTAVANRETFFGPGCLIDTASITNNPAVADGIGVDIQDTGGFVFFRNTWVSFAGTLIRTGTSFAGTVQIDGGILFKGIATYGGAGRAIQLGSTSSVLVASGTIFQEVTNEGIICTAGTNGNVHLRGPVFRTDVGTPVHSSIDANTLANTQAVFNGKLVGGGVAPIASFADGSPSQTFVQGLQGGSTHVVRYFNDASPTRVEISKSRSGSLAGQTIVQTSDVLGAVTFNGSDGTQLRPGAEIRAIVEGTPGSDDLPTGLEFYTRGSAAGSMARRMRISDGGLVILDALPTYADNASAVAGGVPVNGLYKTATGEMRVRV